jgi:MFS transporter, DHA2 family, multidrug resistance protein
MAIPTRSSTDNQHKARWLVLVPLLLGILASSLATGMINTALPTIASKLSVSDGTRAWIVGAYPLAVAVAMVTAARLGEHYGRRRVMFYGLVGFAAINMVAGLASTGLELVACRAVLGLAGAMILASVVSTVGATYRDHDLVIANAAWVTIVGVGAAAGPIVGGVLTQAAGWRSVFICLVPLALATAALVSWLMPEARSASEKTRWDLASVALSVMAVGGIIYGVQQVAGNPLIGSSVMLGGGLSAVWFARRQMRAPAPMIDVLLFGRGGFARSVTHILVSAAVSAACLYLVSLHLQHALGRTPAQAGLMLVPLAVGTAVGGVVAPFALRLLTTDTAVRVALLMQAAGLLALAGGEITVLAPIALVGCGYGAVGTIATATLMHAATPPRAAQAGAIQEVAFALGSGAGIAFFGVIAGTGSHAGFALAMAVAAFVTVAAAGIPSRRPTAKSDAAKLPPSCGCADESPGAPQTTQV